MNNNIKTSFKYLLSTSLLITSLNAASTDTQEDILLKYGWMNLSNSSAKDVMMSGATTATAKGYSALFANPAGLSTNYAAGLYLRSSQMEHKNDSGSSDEENSLVMTQEVEVGDAPAVGIFYKSLIVEMKPDVHTAIGLAYGLETRYGLFSLGINYVIDDSTPSADSEELDMYKTFATGDYYTAGIQWQKSFVGIDDFYAIYLGYSKKGQGANIQEDEQIGAIVSPVTTKMGIGLETNMFTTTVLLTADLSTQEWLDIDATKDTTAFGLKWMLFDGFSIAGGTSTTTYTTGVDLNEASTVSAGIEFSAWSMNVAIAALQQEVLNNADDVYIEETSAHVDVSFAF